MHKNSIKFFLSSTDKGAVGFILAQELAILTLVLDFITSRHCLPWNLPIFILITDWLLTNTMLSWTTAALQWVRDCRSTDLLFLTGQSTEFLFLDIWSTELLFLTGPEMVLSIFRPLEHRISIFNLATVNIFLFLTGLKCRISFFG